MSRPTRASAEGRAYLDLQNMARRQGRTTEELLQLYCLEGFLARLAHSRHSGRLVLKGGVLLAAFGSRRPTRDIDFATSRLGNEAGAVLELVREVAALDIDDGLRFDAASARAELIREEDEYSGVRVTLNASLHQARMRFHVDVNVGDPVWPRPLTVHVPRLLSGEAITLPGYPLHMVHAEKLVTAVQRGTASTRWRDFGDIWTLSGRLVVNGRDLVRAVAEVADYRRVDPLPLAEVLDGYAELAQARYALWRRKQRLAHLPEDFGVLLQDVINFGDPAISGSAREQAWEPAWRCWH